MNEESAYPCPVCHTLTTLEHACPGCGRAPDPNAAAVITLDHRIVELRAQVDQAKRSFEELSAQLSELRRQREHYATVVRSSVAQERSVSSLPTVQVSAPPLVPAPARAEAAPRTVQNLLFILGGLLLGTAALVFTAVAWVAYGVTGRAVILGLVTLATLAVPPLVRRRGLVATAETFATLGLFLVLLDGYAAWFNLPGIQDTWDGSFYAGTVCLVTALLGVGYGKLFHLTGPRLIALAAAQPVLPLYFAESSAKADIWALVFAGVAVANAIVLWRKPRPVVLAVLGWIFHGVALLVAVGLAVTQWGADGTIRASLVLVAVTLAFAAGAWVSSDAAHRGFAAAAFVLAVVAAVIRPLYDRVPEPRLFVIWSAVAAVAVLLSWYAVRTLPGPWSTGARWGATVSLLGPGIIAFVWAVAIAASNVSAAFPWWHAEPKAFDGSYVWELPLALVLLVAAGALLAPGVARKLAVVSGMVALALALPGWPPVTPWAPSAIDLLVATGLLAWALTVPGRFGLIAKGIGALILIGHALWAGQGSPMQAMFVMLAIVALCLVVSTIAPRSLLRPGVTIEGRHTLGGISAGLAELILPWLAFTAVAAFGGDLVASWRLLVLVVLAVPLLGTQKAFRGYQVVAGLVSALYPLWPDLPGNESPAVYAALSAVAMTLVGIGCRWAWVRWAPLLPAFVVLLWTAPSWYAVLLQPFENLTHIWGGDPLTPHVTLLHAVAVTLLLATLATTRNVRLIAFAAVIPALLWLAVLEVPWPAIAGVGLVGGLAMLLVSAMRGKDPVLGVVGAFLALTGLAGSLPEKWSTITALALVSVVMVAIGVAGRSLPVRVLAWLASAVAMVLLAVSIGQAANLRPDVTAYLVLLAAGVLLLIAYSPLARGARAAAAPSASAGLAPSASAGLAPSERGSASVAVEASAHASAAVALALCQGAPRPAAGVLAIWGVAIGLTALRRQPVPRAVLAAVAVWFAWVLLLRAESVGTLEAYTLPIAVLAIAVGVMAARKQAGLSSWMAYGPATAAALLPSLGAVLIEPEGLTRRLLLGVGALIVTIAGAIWRRQAPFLLGGATLLVLAAHELALVWQMVDAWIPLAIGGLLLVGLAITYERRLRDLSRLRDMVSRMT